MNFDIYKAPNGLDIKKITKKTSSFWIKRNHNSEIELFHLNKISKEMVHCVFFISDEYQIGAKKSGSQISIPFNQYVNTFIFPEKGFIFVEFINNPYIELVIAEYRKIFKTEFSQYTFSNHEMEKIKTSLKSTITTIEYKNLLDDEIFSLETKKEISNAMPILFSENNSISYLLLNINNNLVSIKENRVISISNDNDEFLTSICEEIINAII